VLKRHRRLRSTHGKGGPSVHAGIPEVIPCSVMQEVPCQEAIVLDLLANQLEESVVRGPNRFLARVGKDAPGRDHAVDLGRFGGASLNPKGTQVQLGGSSPLLLVDALPDSVNEALAHVHPSHSC
jgi:hypothetical protein